MAKTKWIVPAIALVLCAASLIGAGYAAYAASLQDNESVNVSNSYVVVSYGATPTKTNMKIDYDTVNTYSGGADNTISYQAKNTVSKVLSFKVTEQAT